MFQSLGRFIIRNKWLVIAFWIALATFMVLAAPTLSDVGTSNEIDFLPDGAPSLTAQQILEEKFPEMASAGDLLLVLYDPDGIGTDDKAYAQDLNAWLKSEQAPEQVGKVTSIFENPEMEPLLISQDGQVMLIQVGLTSEPYSDGSNLAVEQIRDHIAETRPAGIEVDVTGQAAIGRDLIYNILSSVDKTTWATIILVIFVLLIIYRSPIAAGVPLLTIGTAFVITRGILGYLAQAGMNISSMMDAFIVVLVFGVGTDYALFLISRYREEVARRPNHDREAADIDTIAKIGPVITASAATVVIGTLGMMVARFEMTKTQGPAMAIAIVMALLASLSLTPALLSVLGAHLFWPFHRKIRDHQTEQRSPLWEKIAIVITSRPGLVAALVTCLMLLPYFALPQMVKSFDIMGELPQSTEARRGFETIKAHFDAGELMPVAVVFTDGDNLQSPEGLSRIAAIHESLAQVEGVDKVRSVVHPTAGEDAELEKALLAAYQVRMLADGLEQNMAKMDISALSDPASDPSASFILMEKYLDELSTAFPEIKDEQAYTDSRRAIVDLRSEIDQAMDSLQVSVQLNMLSEQIQGMSATLNDSAALFQNQQGQDPTLGLVLLQTYLDELVHAYPEVTDDSDYKQAIQAIDTLNQAMESMQQQTQVSVQLGMLAAQMDAFQQSLKDPQTLMAPPAPDQPSPADQLNLLSAYMQELAQAYPDVQTQPAYGDALSHLQNLSASLDQMAQAQAAGMTPTPEQMGQIVAGLQTETQALSADLGALAQSFAGQDVPFVSQTLMQSPIAQQQMAALRQAAADLQSGLDTLAQRFDGRDAPFMPQSLMTAMADQSNPADAIQINVRQLTDALYALADSLPQDAYFLPDALLEEQPGAGKLLDAFISDDHTAAQIQLLVSGDPYGDAAMETIRLINAAAKDEASSQQLTAYVAGPTVQIFDVRETVNQDFPRVMVVVTLGVFVVFILLLGSLVAPIYLVATVLLSYGTTMGLVTILFQDILNASGVNYAIPIVIFVLLVALGADYNIFLTSRVWEEAEKHGDVREGVRHASAYTGGVITSAGIILAGTFAALMVSSLQSLFQIGAAVAIGVLVDTFIVRALLVPAIAAFVGRFNWWPAKHPVGHGGIFRLLSEKLFK